MQTLSDKPRQKSTFYDYGMEKKKSTECGAKQREFHIENCWHKRKNGLNETCSHDADTLFNVMQHYNM